MTDDRPPTPSRADARPGREASRPAFDAPTEAVFEDLEPATPPVGPAPVWDAVPVESAPPDAPVIQVGDPFADVAPMQGDGYASLDALPATPPLGPDAPPMRDAPLGVPEPPDAPAYDEQAGFRIAYDGAAPSTALVPVRSELPAVRPSAPPPAGPPPRAQARHAARDKGRMLRRHWGLILLCTLVGGLGALAYSLWTPEVYEAYSVLLIDGDRPGGAEGSMVSEFVGVPGEDGREVRNQALVRKQAPAMADSTAAALLARPDALALSTVRQAAAEAGTEGAPTPERLSDYLQREVVRVTPAGEEVDAVRVEARAGSPDEAALIATVYTREYREFTGETNRAQVRATREFLDEQVARREGELSEIEAQLKAYLTANNAAGLQAQTSARVGQIAQLQSGLDAARVQVQSAQARLSALEAELASVPQRLEAAASVATTPGEVAQIDQQITELETLVNQVYLRNPELRGNPNAHPDLRQMTGELTRLRAERQRIAGDRVGTAVAAGGLDLSSPGANGEAYISERRRQISQERAALQGARAQVSAFQSRLGATTAELRGIPRDQIEIDQLERRRTQAAGLVSTLSEQLERARVAEQAELGTTQLVREVQRPIQPVAPNLPLNVALGTLLGFLVGLAGAVTRYRTDARAFTPDDLEEHGFAVLGTVPDLSDALRGGRVTMEETSVHPGLVTLTRPFSLQAEAFRHLGAALRAGAGAAEVLLVGGPEAETGKSLVATNLAVAAAQSGKRVLLVDADLRKPTVGALLGLGGQPALGEGTDEMNVVYWNTLVPSLFALTPRDTAAAPDQLWTPEQIGRLLGNLRPNFDLILLDTPPALATADLTLVAPYADGALLVAEAGRTDLDALTRVASDLAGAGLTRVGAVLNRYRAGAPARPDVAPGTDRQLT